jgi:hypothetical protein
MKVLVIFATSVHSGLSKDIERMKKFIKEVQKDECQNFTFPKLVMCTKWERFKMFDFARSMILLIIDSCIY